MGCAGKGRRRWREDDVGGRWMGRELLGMTNKFRVNKKKYIDG